MIRNNCVRILTRRWYVQRHTVGLSANARSWRANPTHPECARIYLGYALLGKKTGILNTLGKVRRNCCKNERKCETKADRERCLIEPIRRRTMSSSSTRSSGSDTRGTVATEQLVGECFVKCAHIILSSRVNTTLDGARSPAKQASWVS
jgi:hypothetical protein